MSSKKITAAYEYQAYRILQVLYVILSIGKGVDKIFFHFSGSTRIDSPFSIFVYQMNEPHLILGIGIAEVLMGIGIIFQPRFFAFFLAVWFSVIVIVFVTMLQFLDVALRDFVLICGALALGLLSRKYST